MSAQGFGNCAKPSLLEYHKSTIFDMDFSPFNENVLVTASQDTTLKIKILPDGGLTENTREFDADLKGHTKKVLFC